MTRDYMAKPCAHCPFRTDVPPFLHPERAADIAYSAQNRYSDFPCHKTLEHDEDDGEGYRTETSLTCAGFIALQINEAGIDEPEGWVWPNNVYSDVYDMCGAYKKAWKQRQSSKSKIQEAQRAAGDAVGEG